MNKIEFMGLFDGKGITPPDLERIDFAYDVAKVAHRGQKRDSGESYFMHPRRLVKILTNECQIYDSDLVVALLLHDTGEDSRIWGDLRQGFEKWRATAYRRIVLCSEKPRVANLVIALTKPKVDGVTIKTKIDVVAFNTECLKAAGADGLFCKAVDRLDNLRDSFRSDPAKRVHYVQETKEIYMPLFEEFLVGHSAAAPYLLNQIRKILEDLEKLQ